MEHVMGTYFVRKYIPGKYRLQIAAYYVTVIIDHVFSLSYIYHKIVTYL